ncbi:MAG: hypothetical protein RIB84_25975 [Sneathiellaceae bacterium]
MLVIGLSWLPGLALFLPGLGDLAKEGTLFCSYFEALPGQPLGLAVATDDAAVLRCHFDPLAAAIVLSPLPIFGVVVTGLLVTFLWPSASSAGPDAGRPTAKRFTAGARMTNCPDRSRRRWPGGRLGAPLLAFLYFAALAVCLILGGIDDLPGTALVIAPILTVLAFPVALPLAWLLQRLAPGMGQRLHRQGPRDGQSPCSMNSRP